MGGPLPPVRARRGGGAAVRCIARFTPVPRPAARREPGRLRHVEVPRRLRARSERRGAPRRVLHRGAGLGVPPPPPRGHPRPPRRLLPGASPPSPPAGGRAPGRPGQGTTPPVLGSTGDGREIGRLRPLPGRRALRD